MFKDADDPTAMSWHLIRSMEYNREYTKRLLESRCSGSSVGSYFNHTDWVDLYIELVGLDWHVYEHPAVVGEGVFALRATIPGTTGIVNLEDIDDSIWVVLEDPKSTGNLSCHCTVDSSVLTFTCPISL